MKKVVISAVQMKMSENIDENIEKAAKYVEEAAKSGANVILLPELFESLYFCQEKNYDFYELAHTPEEDKGIAVMKKLAKELGLCVTAEGVEREEQVDFLKQMKCDSIQGYYYSRPLPKDEFEKLLLTA